MFFWLKRIYPSTLMQNIDKGSYKKYPTQVCQVVCEHPKVINQDFLLF